MEQEGFLYLIITFSSNLIGGQELKQNKFKSYFNAKKFTNLTKETQPIAEAIAPYFDKQDIFKRTCFLS